MHVFPNSYGDMPEFTQKYLDSILPFFTCTLFVRDVNWVICWFSISGDHLLLLFWTPLTVNFLIFNITNLIVNIQYESFIANFGKLWPASLVAILNILLIIQYKEKYKPLFN